MGGIRHPRRLTKQQFSDGTTIDGPRIEDAVADLVEHFNHVELGDLSSAFTQTQFVAGWMPQDPASGSTHHWPFMPKDNVAAEVVGAQPVRFENALRTKASEVPVPRLASVLTDVFTWTTSIPFNTPVILRDMTLFLTTDFVGNAFETFDNTFLYGPTATSFPPNLNTAAVTSVEDFSIVISIDSELGRLKRSLNDVEVVRTKFQVARDQVSFGPLPASAAGPPAYTDMTPGPWPAGTVQGVCIRLRDLNVPLHQRARVRMDMVIPQYTNGENGWQDDPWYRQYITSTMTVLEPLV